MGSKPKAAISLRYANDVRLKSNMITALYCRTAQASDMGIETQENMLRSYAEENSLSNVSVYTDNGYSGLNFDRPALRRLKADVDAGLVGSVLVRDISRISRNFDEAPKFLEYMWTKGVMVKSIMDGFDSEERIYALQEIAQAFNQFYTKSKRGAKAL